MMRDGGVTTLLTGEPGALTVDTHRPLTLLGCEVAVDLKACGARVHVRWEYVNDTNKECHILAAHALPLHWQLMTCATQHATLGCVWGCYDTTMTAMNKEEVTCGGLGECGESAVQLMSVHASAQTVAVQYIPWRVPINDLVLLSATYTLPPWILSQSPLHIQPQPELRLPKTQQNLSWTVMSLWQLTLPALLFPRVHRPHEAQHEYNRLFQSKQPRELCDGLVIRISAELMTPLTPGSVQFVQSDGLSRVNVCRAQHKDQQTPHQAAAHGVRCQVDYVGDCAFRLIYTQSFRSCSDSAACSSSCCTRGAAPVVPNAADSTDASMMHSQGCSYMLQCTLQPNKEPIRFMVESDTGSCVSDSDRLALAACITPSLATTTCIVNAECVFVIDVYTPAGLRALGAALRVALHAVPPSVYMNVLLPRKLTAEALVERAPHHHTRAYDFVRLYGDVSQPISTISLDILNDVLCTAAASAIATPDDDVYRTAALQRAMHALLSSNGSTNTFAVPALSCSDEHAAAALDKIMRTHTTTANKTKEGNANTNTTHASGAADALNAYVASATSSSHVVGTSRKAAPLESLSTATTDASLHCTYARPDGYVRHIVLLSDAVMRDPTLTCSPAQRSHMMFARDCAGSETDLHNMLQEAAQQTHRCRVSSISVGATPRADVAFLELLARAGRGVYGGGTVLDECDLLDTNACFGVSDQASSMHTATLRITHAMVRVLSVCAVPTLTNVSAVLCRHGEGNFHREENHGNMNAVCAVGATTKEDAPCSSASSNAAVCAAGCTDEVKPCCDKQCIHDDGMRVCANINALPVLPDATPYYLFALLEQHEQHQDERAGGPGTTTRHTKDASTSQNFAHASRSNSDTAVTLHLSGKVGDKVIHYTGTCDVRDTMPRYCSHQAYLGACSATDALRRSTRASPTWLSTDVASQIVSKSAPKKLENVPITQSASCLTHIGSDWRDNMKSVVCAHTTGLLHASVAAARIACLCDKAHAAGSLFLSSSDARARSLGTGVECNTATQPNTASYRGSNSVSNLPDCSIARQDAVNEVTRLSQSFCVPSPYTRLCQCRTGSSSGDESAWARCTEHPVVHTCYYDTRQCYARELSWRRATLATAAAGATQQLCSCSSVSSSAMITNDRVDAASSTGDYSNCAIDNNVGHDCRMNAKKTHLHNSIYTNNNNSNAQVAPYTIIPTAVAVPTLMEQYAHDVVSQVVERVLQCESSCSAPCYVDRSKAHPAIKPERRCCCVGGHVLHDVRDTAMAMVLLQQRDTGAYEVNAQLALYTGVSELTMLDTVPASSPSESVWATAISLAFMEAMLAKRESCADTHLLTHRNSCSHTNKRNYEEGSECHLSECARAASDVLDSPFAITLLAQRAARCFLQKSEHKEFMSQQLPTPIAHGKSVARRDCVLDSEEWIREARRLLAHA